jgi:hypothetical protein
MIFREITVYSEKILNTLILCVGKMKSCLMLKRVVYIVTLGFKNVTVHNSPKKLGALQ